MSLVLEYFVLAFSALLPVINPLGSALIFLGVVGEVPPGVFRNLARRVAISTVLFLLVVELIGSTILTFFGISLPVVQLAGGFVLAGMGWGLLNERDDGKTAPKSADPCAGGESGAVEDKIFYPLTFPLTAGPGCIVVMLTLSAHASGNGAIASIMAHVGIAVAVLALSLSVAVCYIYAPKITQKISAQTAQGILRVIAFVLMCIGVQIAANGLQAMIAAVRK